PFLFANVRTEPIGASAHRARADEFRPCTFQPNAAASKLALDRDGFCEGEDHRPLPLGRVRKKFRRLKKFLLQPSLRSWYVCIVAFLQWPVRPARRRAIPLPARTVFAC